MRKMPQKKSHSIFTPVEEGRSSKKVAPRRKSLLEESRSSKKVAPRRKSLHPMGYNPLPILSLLHPRSTRCNQLPDLAPSVLKIARSMTHRLVESRRLLSITPTKEAIEHVDKARSLSLAPRFP
ncbi:hypothetical protein E4U28_008510 [Claviceps purpurea]|nr:hypothetical protein E4U28_008510 [Claviceps purpurea]